MSSKIGRRCIATLKTEQHAKNMLPHLRKCYPNRDLIIDVVHEDMTEVWANPPKTVACPA